MVFDSAQTLSVRILLAALFIGSIYLLLHILFGNPLVFRADRFRSFSTRNETNNQPRDDMKSSQEFLRKYFNADLNDHWLRVIKNYISLPLESGYASHQLVLLAASLLTAGQGPVLEMGCGFYSTVLLHQLVVVEQKRYLLSTDTDLEWLSKFKGNMSSDLHQFRHISATPEWDTVGTDRPRWSIMFIDHKPGERRVVDLIRVANLTDLVIVHDTETASYNYEQGLSKYPYRYHYNYLATGTDIASRDNGTLFHAIRRLLELTIEMKVPK